MFLQDLEELAALINVRGGNAYDAMVERILNSEVSGCRQTEGTVHYGGNSERDNLHNQ